SRRVFYLPAAQNINTVARHKPWKGAIMALDPETLAALTDTVARFVRERLRPLEAQVAEEDAIPAGIRAEMAALGLFGLSIPEAYGGLGLGMEEEVLVALELGRTSPA